ncbi:serine/threonine protein kinase [bacterium]|nr:serine/threonine protein kinase [Mariniblastus sp.]MDA7861681.1 serine/threonine protein kinase [bacterium]MDA7905730.1 serine/threonine protein kinase [Mariniblastus sp.]MDB4483965.1 serine/threonine protein kinase [bacterium]MDC3223485.1 serine/threonine protein kinase [Mariniblastus sp.]
MENTHVGPFKIVSQLGSRRQKVYRAVQTEQGREVALKFIKLPPTVEWEKAIAKIDREVIGLQDLVHPGLVKVYGAGVDQQRVFFASELIEGESLATVLSRRGKLTPDLVVEYGRQIADVLRYLHSKDLIHSKLTPEKILLTSEHRIKIADLRLNRPKKRRWDKTRRRELETAAYMAPEQFVDGATQKSDFYSLGVVLFEMLTGKLPYPPDTIGRMTKMKLKAEVPSVASHIMNCPIWLDKIISQMLSPDAKQRPHSARAIVLAFDEIKNIDATKKSAISQISGGFNPLTIGADKSEARRLLGVKKKKQKRVRKTDTPLIQTVAFQVVAFLAVACFIIYCLIPESSSEIVARAEVMVESGDPVRWAEAEILLKPLMDGDSEVKQTSEELFYEARRKSLVRNAERGLVTRLQTENVLDFGRAVQLQLDESDESAKRIFTKLAASVDPDGRERHVYQESVVRLGELTSKRVLPTDINELSEMIAIAKDVTTPDQMATAHDLLSEIVFTYSGQRDYRQLVVIATEQLKLLKQKIESEADVVKKIDPEIVDSRE